MGGGGALLACTPSPARVFAIAAAEAPPLGAAWPQAWHPAVAVTAGPGSSFGTNALSSPADERVSPLVLPRDRVVLGVMSGLKNWISFGMKLEDTLTQVNTCFKFHQEAEK